MALFYPHYSWNIHGIFEWNIDGIWMKYDLHMANWVKIQYLVVVDVHTKYGIIGFDPSAERDIYIYTVYMAGGFNHLEKY